MQSKSLLVLPVGGSATRMLGLPKFMLPVSENETLIEKHCLGAEAAGYNEIHIITRTKYFDILSDFIEVRNLNVSLHTLPVETETMSETLITGGGMIPNFKSSSITIGLADTCFVGAEYADIYSSLKESKSEFALGLFAIRPDQRGKLGQVNLDEKGNVETMMDKNSNCDFPNIWGLAKVPGEMILSTDPRDPHIGIGIEKLVELGTSVAGVINDSKYYDCGTFDEYRKCLNEMS